MSGTVRIATGIAKLARKALSGEHEETVLHGEPSAKDVFDAVKAGEHLQLALRMNSDDILERHWRVLL